MNIQKLYEECKRLNITLLLIDCRLDMPQFRFRFIARHKDDGPLHDFQIFICLSYEFIRDCNVHPEIIIANKILEQYEHLKDKNK